MKDNIKSIKNDKMISSYVSYLKLQTLSVGNYPFLFCYKTQNAIVSLKHFYNISTFECSVPNTQLFLCFLSCACRRVSAHCLYSGSFYS